MRLLQSICLLVALGLCAAAGWDDAWGGHGWSLLVALLSAFLLALALFARGGSSAWAYGMALLVGVFAVLSGVASPDVASLGATGFAAFHILVLGGYGLFLAVTLWKIAREERVDEEFMARDLWLVNIAVVCFAAVTVLQVMASGWAWRGIVAALAKGLLPLSIAVLFAMVVRLVQSRNSLRLWSAILILATVASMSLGVGRYSIARSALARGESFLAADLPTEALEEVDVAVAQNAVLRCGHLDAAITLVRRNAFAALGDSPQALVEMKEYFVRRLGGKVSETELSFLQRYLDPTPLAALLVEVDTDDEREAWSRLHRRLARDPVEESEVLGLFLEQGLVDRLEERYAWAGLGSLPTDLLLQGLERFIVRHEKEATRGHYLLGALQFRAGDLREARQAFARVLVEEPSHANAVVYQERCARVMRNQTQLADLQARERRIGREGERVIRGGGWFAFEVNPGKYRLEFEVRAVPAGRSWPLFSVYVDGAAEPVYSRVVRGEDWTWGGVEVEFEEEGRHRLRIASDGPRRERGGPQLFLRESLARFTPSD